ncbi:MAG: hypothetical protein EOM41_06720 [Bacilli bacterium]|nr:hypothetical protein [Bacilli bacterium]
MFEYNLITGRKEEVVETVTKMLNDGWTALDLTSTTIGSTINFTQAMTRTIDTSSTARTNPKRVKK